MHYVWLILGNLWMLPNTIVSAVYLGVLALFGQVRYKGVGEWSVNLWVVEGSWLWRYMDRGNWAAWASGVFVIGRASKYSQRTLRHESRHVQQQMWLGPLQPVIYVLISVFIWAVLKDLHPYLDNSFEKDARRYAGQQVDIPKSAWGNDPRGRWYWWILLITTGFYFQP